MFSTDVEGWSPNMDRDCFLEHFQYMIEMTTEPDLSNWTNCWKNFTLVNNKMGAMFTSPVKNGNFQGFPGTSDT